MNHSINNLFWERIKPTLNREFQSTCVTSNPVNNYFLEYDIPKKTKDTKEAELSKNVIRVCSHEKGNTFHQNLLFLGLMEPAD